MEQPDLDTSAMLSPEEIELINARGPFSHAAWTGRGVRISGEEWLSGRGELLAKLVRDAILKRFEAQEVPKLSILDVGCYDGWILEQLSDLPVARLVGVEPRPKNIEKGRVVRDILGIPSRVEYRVGGIESLGGEVFDVVICTGLLQHLESPGAAIRQLSVVCRRLLFLETMCLSSKHITRALREEIEMKDLVYQYKQATFGVTAQKLESSYYDGSAASLSVVSLPSVESLALYLDVAGFKNVEIVVEPHRYRAALWGRQRPANAVCLTALRGDPAQGFEETWVRDYEKGLMDAVLPRRHLAPLYERVCRGGPRWDLFSLVTAAYLHAGAGLARWIRRSFKLWFRGRYELEILKNLRYNPKDKVALEYGKLLCREGNDPGAVDVLKEVTQRLNADWRAAYRSMFLLSQAYARMGDDGRALHYEALCRTCNPEFPLAALRPAR